MEVLHKPFASTVCHQVRVPYVPIVTSSHGPSTDCEILKVWRIHFAVQILQDRNVFYFFHGKSLLTPNRNPTYNMHALFCWYPHVNYWLNCQIWVWGDMLRLRPNVYEILQSLTSQLLHVLFIARDPTTTAPPNPNSTNFTEMIQQYHGRANVNAPGSWCSN